MPDSQLPPLWGPADDERDLDALLSGDWASIAVALQPVVSTLAALRAAATARELSDEAAARGAFRAFSTATAAPPATLPPPAGRRRHRHRRQASGGGRTPGLAVTLAAAAALIVVAVAVTGVLTGFGSITSSFGRQPASASASARTARPSPGSQAVLASGAAPERTATPKPTPTASGTPNPTSEADSMCRQYFEYFLHPAAAGAAGERALYWQLAKSAGSGVKILGYCLHLPGKPLAGMGPSPTGTFGGGHGPNGWQYPGAGGPGAPAAGGPGAPAARGPVTPAAGGPGGGVGQP